MEVRNFRTKRQQEVFKLMCGFLSERSYYDKFSIEWWKDRLWIKLYLSDHPFFDQERWVETIKEELEQFAKTHNTPENQISIGMRAADLTLKEDGRYIYTFAILESSLEE